MGFTGREKHFYLGGNTPLGFFSYYDHLVPQEAARKIYCIKGGPGTGKSSFMKKMAAEMIKRGYDVEMMHCSSDNNSLDGILIKPANIAFVDGTSPHIVDPKTPGAVDEVLNFGACWNENAIRTYKDDIIRINRQIGGLFSHAYVYLAAAKKLLDDMELIRSNAICESAYSNFLENIIFQEFAEIPISEVPGRTRRLFASAITPQGMVHYLDTVLLGYKTYVIKGATGDPIGAVADIAVRRGFDVEKYYCPFAPTEKCDHLLIPKLNLAFTTSNQYHRYSIGELVDFNDYANKYLLEKHREELDFDQIESDRLIGQAIKTIADAKTLHDELEKYYIPNMDFEQINAVYAGTLEQVLAMIKGA